MLARPSLDRPKRSPALISAPTAIDPMRPFTLASRWQRLVTCGLSPNHSLTATIPSAEIQQLFPYQGFLYEPSLRTLRTEMAKSCMTMVVAFSYSDYSSTDLIVMTFPCAMSFLRATSVMIRGRWEFSSSDVIPTLAHSRSKTFGQRLLSASGRQSSSKIASFFSKFGSSMLKNCHKASRLRFFLSTRKSFSSANSRYLSSKLSTGTFFS